MLSRLYIANYALIEELEINFDSGFTIITGETGAGKSIVLGALSLLLGGKADSRAVRNPEHKIVVEATFDIAGYSLEGFFSENEVEYYEHECIVRREVAASGRSRAFINDTPVQVAVLKDITTRLVDIHSQHSNMLLAKPGFQLDILDSLAGNAALLEEYATHFSALQSIEREIAAKRDELARSKSEEDYLSFQLNQFTEMALHEDEDVELEALQNKLSNVNELKDALWQVDSIFNNEGSSVIEQLKTVEQRLAFTEKVMEETQGMAQRVSDCLVDLKDIARSVSSAQESLNLDPAELDRINERLDAIYTLERKHNVSSVNELLEVQHDFEARLASITHGDEEIARLEADCEKQKKVVKKLAASLSVARRDAAGSFVADFKPLVSSLGMKNVAFEIEINPTATFTPSGTDQVEFMMAFNKNQPLMPVKDTASGGEISRVMLCIKSIVARSMHLPTIIFDEVDTGVSGDIATMIGEMMADIAGSIQVMAITHLPQVAACASSHKKVYKSDNEQGTVTSVITLGDDEHVMEIARMLSGKDLDEAAVNNAKSLIKQSIKR